MSLPVNLFYGAGGENNLYCGAGRVSDEDPPPSDEDIDTYTDVSDASDYEQQIYTSDDDISLFYLFITFYNILLKIDVNQWVIGMYYVNGCIIFVQNKKIILLNYIVFSFPWCLFYLQPNVL